MDDQVVISPVARDPSEVPIMSLADYILRNVSNNLDKLGDTPWIVDVISGTSVKFCELEDQSRRVASALSRRGFKKGDVLYFVTYEMAQLYVVFIAVWRLGGTMRGWYQAEVLDEYTRQIRETDAKFILVDSETAPLLHTACTQIEWPLTWLCFGAVNIPVIATSYNQLLEDDGTALPEHVEINPREDIVVIPSTSGSTGNPKGVLHTHFSVVSSLHSRRVFFSSGNTVMCSMVNFSAANFTLTFNSACYGVTVYQIGKFSKEDYFDLLQKYQPENVVMYPYLAAWFARCHELGALDLSFIRHVGITAWILDPGTVALLAARLPHATVVQSYGMTECVMISSNDVQRDPDSSSAPVPPFVVHNQGEQCVSTGQLFPYVKAKVMDNKTGKILPRGQRGEILVQTPSLMKGYLVPGHQIRANVDDDGWLHTGDLGFIDEDGNLFISERLNFMYKYKTVPVLPSEIEGVLQEHPDVMSAGVVGIPNVETDNLTRAFVVLRDGSEQRVTAEQLVQHVAQRLSYYKQLHGGVRFVDELPLNRAGKLDRGTLKKIACTEENEKRGKGTPDNYYM